MFNLKNNDKITANSAIVCINFGKIFATKPVKYSQINKTIAEHLLQNGFFVRAILPPTSTEPIIRFTFSTLHTKRQIKDMVLAIKTCVL